MRKIFLICGLLLFAYCLHTDSNTSDSELLNQRITHLEQKIDSLISDINTNSMVSDNKSGDSSLSYRTILQMNRCQAITKKGTQCKRKAKNDGYCWQHAG